VVNVLRTDLWKKSYLIEFKGTDGKSTSFTFAVPPESEELTYTPVKTETKTFGGIHVDEYTMDTVKITLSGSTINNELKRIYKLEGGEDWLSGEDEIYMLRDLFLKYKQDPKNLKSEIWLYDLSKSKPPGFNTGSGAISRATDTINEISDKLHNPTKMLINNSWHVFPGEFKIRRASDRPFTYKYSFDFTGINEVPGEAESKSPTMTELLNTIMNVLDALEKVLNFMESVARLVGEARAVVQAVISTHRAFMNMIDGIVQAAFDAYSGSIEAVLEGFNGMVDVTFDTVKRTIEIPQDTIARTLDIGLSFQNSAINLMKNVEALTSQIREIVDNGPEEYIYPKEYRDKYEMNNMEFSDTIKRICGEMEDSTYEVVKQAKTELPKTTAGAVQDTGGESGNRISTNRISKNTILETSRVAPIITWGSKEVMIKSTDSLESLANEYLGGADQAQSIALYNGIASLDDLPAGAAIKIPVLNRSERKSNNKIFGKIGDIDNYGRDIALDDEGRIIIASTGDFAIADKTMNLSQAVLLRLRESVDKRIRLNTYGIKMNLNNPDASAAYILSSINRTLLEEPRIKTVININFQGFGDGMQVTVDYVDINNTASGTKGMV
jgi:hypothetical protein